MNMDYPSQSSQKPSALAMAELQVLRHSIVEIGQLVNSLEDRISYLENKLALHAKSGLPSHYRMETELQDYFDERNAADKLQPFTLLIIQLEDHFALIRKTFPNSVIDWILFQIGERIRDRLNPGDRVFHTTDNEFILAIQDLRGPALRAFIKLLFDAIDEIHVFSGFNLRVSGHGGASFYPEHGTEKGQLLHHADLALSACSNEKKRFVLFSKELHQAVIDRAELQSSILKALETPFDSDLGQQFHMHYQPQVVLERDPDGRYRVVDIKAEALIRWHHPQKGWVPPGSFIPLAEESGLILPLGKWTIFKVAEHLERWQGGLLGRTGVSINLSARQFASDEVLEILSHILTIRDIQPKRFTLELTETSVFKDPVRATRIMQDLRALGLRISVDDFGTGYSSLSLLHRFPIHEIKIDRMFIENVCNNLHDQSIVRSLVALSLDMGLGLVAEGVDNRATLDVLYDNGCRIFQGWLIAKAMGPEDFEAYCASIEAADFLLDLPLAPPGCP